MKKTILVAMIAVAMLFAFTACEQSVPTYKNADYLTINQTAAFIEGQEFNANNFEVVVHYTDGSTSTIPGAGVVKVESGWTDGASTTATVSAELTSTLKFTSYNVQVVPVSECEISAVQLNVSEVEKWMDKDAEEDFVLDGSNPSFSVKSVTYTYEGVSYVDDEDVSGFTVNGKIAAEDLKTVGKKTVVINVYKGTVAEANLVGEAELTVNVIDPNAGTAKTPIKKAEVDKLEVKWTVIGVDGKEITAPTGNTITVKAGETVSYEIYGTKADGLGAKEEALLLSSSSDYTLSLNTLSSIVGKKLGASNITGTTPAGASAAVAAYTATVNFKADDPEDDNWTAGSVDPITLSVTVKDNLDTISAGDWAYDTSGDGKADEVEAGKDLTVVPANIKKTVKSIGGVEVKLVGTAIKDRTTYKAAEVVAGQPITVEFKWAVDSTQSSAYSATGYDSVTIGVKASV